MLSDGRHTDVHGWARVQRAAHSGSNAASRRFDVQGAVSVVHVCPLKSSPALGVKHGNKANNIFESVKRHICCFTFAG